MENPRQIGKCKNAERASVMRFLAYVFFKLIHKHLIQMSIDMSRNNFTFFSNIRSGILNIPGASECQWYRHSTPYPCQWPRQETGGTVLPKNGSKKDSGTVPFRKFQASLLNCLSSMGNNTASPKNRRKIYLNGQKKFTFSLSCQRTGMVIHSSPVRSWKRKKNIPSEDKLFSTKGLTRNFLRNRSEKKLSSRRSAENNLYVRIFFS
jgi:hypothetical protein